MRVPTFCCVLLIAGAVALEGCGSSTPATTSFTQADLTGTWDRIGIQTASSAGWFFHTLVIDGAGGATFDACLTPAGACSLTGSLKYTLDADGVLTASGTAGNPTLHGAMTRGKNLMFATASAPGTGAATGYALHIFRKRVPGVTWSSADVANVPFVYQAIHTGTGSNWERGVGSTDASGSISVASVETPAGPSAPPPAGFDRLQVDANGVVTLANTPSFRGVMSGDKKAVFGVLNTTATPGPEYELMVILATGASFASSDLAGSYDFHMLTSGPTVASSGWVYGTLDVGTAGAVTFTSGTTQNGTTTIPGFNLALGPSGAITRPDLVSYLGQMSSQKDFFVRTQTSNGANSLAIVTK